MVRPALALLLIASPTASPGPPSLADLLERAGEYVVAYDHDASGVVLEESYRQSVGTGNQFATRLLISDLVLVSVPGEAGLLGLRDVFKVDGTLVRDRDARLEKLFLHPSAAGVAQAQAVLWESARYNLGPTRRNYNLPTMPLVVLRPENRQHFSFSLGESRTVLGRRARVVAFEELEAPTLIRDSDKDRDFFLRGAFTLEEETGAVLRSEMWLNLRPGRSDLTVEYEWVEALSLWLPARMKENCDPAQSGSATYGKPRRFEVTTQEKVNPPK